VVQAPDKIALSGLAREGRVQRGIQDHLGLLKCCQLIKVAQELKEPDIAWQVGFAETPKGLDHRVGYLASMTTSAKQ